MTRIDAEDPDFSSRIPDYVSRIERCLDTALAAADQAPERLHSAMRYAALSGGKRIRPLLVYGTGECLDVAPERCDVPATAIEFIHAFSLVHDDLPAMDDDDLRRGQPTVHRAFDEATAILAADALQPLAFQVIAESDLLEDSEARALIALISGACGSLGMTGGQAIDLQSEGRDLSTDELARMHSLKTGALISASVTSACYLAPGLTEENYKEMHRFSRDIGLAFQIRDDILDVEGETEVIGKPSGSDAGLRKATWPALFGLDESKRRCDELLESAIDALTPFGDRADPLRQLAALIVGRQR
jgi:geranylgeranyl pyrophosphate synthase